jgi:hypothetical protein
MSRAYGFGALNAKVNTLTSLILTSGTPTPTLQQVTDAGATTNDNIILTTSPPSGNQCTLNNAGIIMLQAGNRQTTLQSDGVVAVDIPTGDYGQLLKDRVKFQVGANLTQIVNNGTELDITGQVSFNAAPHSPDPLLGNDLANKGYVDAIVGNYSGAGLNLFLNSSQPSLNVAGASILSTTVSAAALQTVTTTALGVNTLVASFATTAGFPNLLVLPIGLWQLTVYSYVTSNVGTLFYKFNLYQQPLVGVKVLIASSGDSSDVNATNPATPDAFHMSAPITAPFALALTDVLLLEVLTTGVGMGPLVNINTVFEDGYYSFANTNLSGGTSLLTTNNIWTGTNKFALALNSPALDTETAVALNLGTVNASSINIGKVGVNTTIAATLTALTSRVNSLQTASFGTACDLFTSNTGGIASLFTNAARTATLNIQNASTSANIINIGSATSATNILGLRASTLDSITASVLSVGSNVLTTGVNLNNKVLSNLTLGVNQFINLSANTYSATTGTNVAGSIGYMYVLTTPNGAGFVNGANLTTGATQVYGTLSVPAGVYMVSCTIGLTTLAGNTFQNFWASISSAYSNRSTPPSGPVTDYYYNISGVVAYTALTTVDASLFSIFSGTAPKMISTNFKLSAVRIA